MDQQNEVRGDALRDEMAKWLVELDTAAKAMRAAVGERKSNLLNVCRELEARIDAVLDYPEFQTVWGAEIRQMRELQQSYYKGNQDVLAAAKSIERSVLAAAHTRYNPSQTGLFDQQGRLF